MKRKIVLAVVLCLAAVALLGVAAMPAAAATCTDCHAAPPDGPPAPHGVLVAAVTDCTTCHKGMSPHPDPASLGRPSLSLEFRGSTLSGDLPGIGGRTVYLQQRLWGASDFTDITQVTTSGNLMMHFGEYGYAVPSPTPWVAYRAVAEGGVGRFGGKTNVPAMAVWLPRPKLTTLKLGGVVNGVLTNSGKMTLSGSARPLLLAGESVNLTLQKFRAATHRWVKVKANAAVISATGTYSWRILSFAGGSYRIRASIAATANHGLVRTTWRYFKVM